MDLYGATYIEKEADSEPVRFGPFRCWRLNLLNAASQSNPRGLGRLSVRHCNHSRWLNGLILYCHSVAALPCLHGAVPLGADMAQRPSGSNIDCACLEPRSPKSGFWHPPKLYEGNCCFSAGTSRVTVRLSLLALCRARRTQARNCNSTHAELFDSGFARKVKSGYSEPAPLPKKATNRLTFCTLQPFQPFQPACRGADSSLLEAAQQADLV